MKLPRHLHRLTVFTGPAGSESVFRDWLERQEGLIDLEVVAAAMPGAGGELAARAGDGTIYRGPEAWVACLYALAEYRGWAYRLAVPVLLPFARKVSLHLAGCRDRMAGLFFGRGDGEVAALLERLSPRPAASLGGTTAVPDDRPRPRNRFEQAPDSNPNPNPSQ